MQKTRHQKSHASDPLRKGYRLENIKKMAITTPFGLFEFFWMPLGLHNTDTGSSFQKMINLGGLSLAFCYLHDLWIFSPEGIQTHLSHLRQVF